MILGPFLPQRSFCGGVSVDQIMQACHWKAHNTFTNFYLKTWYKQNFQLEEGSLAISHYPGHLNVEGIRPVLRPFFLVLAMMPRPSKIAFSSTL